MADLIDAVEKTLEFMKSLGLTQEEGVAVAQYAAKTLEYNGIKDSIKEDIKAEILEEIKDEMVKKEY